MRRFEESATIEYKRELTEKFEREVVAFLNSREGGIIFLGIDAARQSVIGLKNADATQRVLDKLDVENRTFTKITSKRRLQKRMIEANALREAVINAIVHNDYLLSATTSWTKKGAITS